MSSYAKWFEDDGDGKDSRLFSGKKKSFKDEVNDTCKLSWRNRVIGFCVCCAIGIVLSFLSLLTLFNVVMFAILYSLGNIVALASTMFLRGPCKQIKSMFDSKRVVATCIYLLAMIATLVVAIWKGKERGMVAVVLILVVIQFLALIWYTASYIPFARTMIINCFTGCCK